MRLHSFIHAVMSSPSDISELLDESLKMKSFSHPNILNLIGVCVDAGPAPYVVMPYMERGSLLQFLKKERPHFTLAEGADSELVSPIPKLHHPHSHDTSFSLQDWFQSQTIICFSFCPELSRIWYYLSCLICTQLTLNYYPQVLIT